MDGKPDRGRLSLNFMQPSPTKPKVPSPSFSETNKSFSLHLLQSRKTTGTLNIKGQTYTYSAEDLIDHGEIGRGSFGSVSKMLHSESGLEMAVKRIRSTVDEREQKHLLKELDIVMNSGDCPYIVMFYGALFKEGDCWICMELMSTSLEKLYKTVHHRLKETIPEDIIGRIGLCVVKALDYLKRKLKIIHRDVKPSNMLVDSTGLIKLCDFGISGHLVDSIARTRDAGCQPYMAPERIDPFTAKLGYDIRSDVWSLGISLIEIATGKFPFPNWNSIFDQLSEVVNGIAPQLVNSGSLNFSDNCLHFVNSCLTKDVKDRPKYQELLLHPFLKENDSKNIDVTGWLNRVKLSEAELPDAT
ncbi:dual specificity mitogen-activated protein kinase kinase 4-like [Rhopilema esculentum]|uniref:dual specificity mitogen-activated protein kinase kinase 4-like n=1 Tax=Rhopilema esculentum TaxID=499914 RepID=UPI0031DE40CE|eukprot:gene9057-16703_t